MAEKELNGRTQQRGASSWLLILTAAVVMLGTLPGRTQGLGLITEPLVADLRLDRVSFANINLWATLLGSLFCFPAGWLFDRFGLRWTTLGIVLLLAGAVSSITLLAGSSLMLFVLLTATRGLGQSALSVASITAVGRTSRGKMATRMAVFSVLIGIFFAVAFGLVGYAIRSAGWRNAWQFVAAFLVLAVAPMTGLFFRSGKQTALQIEKRESAGGYSLVEALQTQAFWIFAGAAALFNFVSSGFGLFNESILAEHGFDQKTFHIFLGVGSLFTLVGQGLCGALSKKLSYRTLVALALGLYAIGLAIIPVTHTRTVLFSLSFVIGSAGGMIIVLFFAIWGEAFGTRQLGRIQGAAQFLTVISSALGPVLFAKCFAWNGSYSPLLYAVSSIVLLVGIAALKVSLPARRAVEMSGLEEAV
jgi:MFS family permease